MAEIKVPDYATIKLWWEKTNELGVAIGDLDLLDDRIKTDPNFIAAAEPNLVSAINSIFSTLDNDRLLLARAIAMS